MLSFFPLDVLDEIWDLIESVSEGFLTYFFSQTKGKGVSDLMLEIAMVRERKGWAFPRHSGFLTYHYFFGKKRI